MTCEDIFVRGDLTVKYELAFGNVNLLLAFLCGCTELKQSISVHCKSVVTPSVCHLKKVCGIENIRGVSSHLTREMVFNSSF